MDQIKQIVDLELAKVATRLEAYSISLQASDAARTLIAELGYDPEMGARPLRRVIQSKVEDRLSDALLTGEFADGDSISVDVADGELVLKLGERAGEEEPAVAAP
jgi:ATP-dependent Clp protease ATP-binding subunit ClpA